MSLDVLIVDRDLDLAKLYCRFLVGHGLTAETAETGLECLRKVRRQAPSLLVLDRELRWRDAAGILTCLREDGLEVPVILTTWNASPKILDRLVEPPVVLCLRKFFPLPALLDGIQFALNNDEQSQDAFSDTLQLTHHGEPIWNASR